MADRQQDLEHRAQRAPEQVAQDRWAAAEQRMRQALRNSAHLMPGWIPDEPQLDRELDPPRSKRPHPEPPEHEPPRSALTTVAQTHGYRVEDRDSAYGVTVLANDQLNDRVAIARKPDGRYIFAQVTDYAARRDDESRHHAFTRLRTSIEHSPSQGEGTDQFERHVQFRRRERERDRDESLQRIQKQRIEEQELIRERDRKGLPQRIPPPPGWEGWQLTRLTSERAAPQVDATRSDAHKPPLDRALPAPPRGPGLGR